MNKIKLASILYLSLLNFFVQAQTSTADGDWSDGTTWGGSSPGFTGLTSPIIDSYVTANNNLNFDSQNNLTLTINDTLIVYGDIVFDASKNNAGITVGTGNVLIVFGDIIMGKNNAGINVEPGGVVVATGSITETGNNGTVSGSGTVYTPSTNMDDSGIGEGTVQPIDNLDGDGFVDIEEFVNGGGTTPLPVDLLFFKAENTRSESVELTWATASEINNDYFSIERSEDGDFFYEIGKVQGNGNTFNTTEYSYKDNFPLASVAYYRLKQVDFNGVFERFGVVRLETKATSNEVKLNIFPSVVRNELISIKSDQSFRLSEIMIYSLNGSRSHNLLNSTIQKDPLTYQVKLSNLKTGVYLLKMRQSTGETQFSRVVIQ